MSIDKILEEWRLFLAKIRESEDLVAAEQVLDVISTQAAEALNETREERADGDE
jgi:hypothetical protein